MSQAVPPQPPVGPDGAVAHPVFPRGLSLAALAVLLAFIGSQGRTLWNEWSVLRAEMSEVRRTAVIGYRGINPHFSYAARPAEWIRREGDTMLFWGGWKEDVGHQWFRVGLGELSAERMSSPIGRDVIQAIDDPVIERRGGIIWGRIPDEAYVVGQRLAGVDTVYPLLVLDKVIVVNDTIGDEPFLVTNNPFAPGNARIVVYEPLVDGRRVTMGLAGCLFDNKPLLFDRGTESLWVSEAETLRAIAGKHKGRQLRPVARPIPVAWGRWKTDHPESRLVVGAPPRPKPEP